MAKTMEEATKAPQQLYRTKEETQPAFRERTQAQATKVRDASADVASLLGSDAAKTKQEHDVSVGMAERLASDHLMAMDEEIKFIENNMKPGESRDIAIKRLQASIAATSGVSAGLGGDAAQAYDKMYIKPARNMATTAMGRWQKEQDLIDKEVMTRDFESFLDSSNTMDQETASVIFSTWKTRLAPLYKNGDAQVETMAATVIARNLIKDSSANPTMSATERAELLKGKDFMGLASVTPEGVIEFHTDNSEANYIISKALGPIMYDAVDEANKFKAASVKSRMKSANDAVTTLTKQHTALAARLKETDNKAEKLAIHEEMKKTQQAIAAYENLGQNILAGTAGNFVKKLTKIESNGSYTALNEESGAYGRYQFMPDTLKEYAKKTGQTIEQAKTPEGQDKMFAQFTEDNATKIASRGLPTSELNLWIAHNQGVGGLDYIVRGIMPKGMTEKKMRRNIAANLPAGMEPTRENYLRHWGKKFSGGDIESTTRTEYSTGADPVSVSDAALADLKGMLADKSSDEKMYKASVKLMEDKAKAGYDEQLKLAKESGNFDGIRKYVYETNEHFLEQTDKRYFDDVTQSELDREEADYKKTFDEKVWKDHIEPAIDARIKGGLNAKDAMASTLAEYGEYVEGEGYKNVGDKIIGKYNQMQIEQNLGLTKPMTARATIELSKNLNIENEKRVTANIDSIKDPVERMKVQKELDDYRASNQRKLDLTETSELGTYEIDTSSFTNAERNAYLARESGKLGRIYQGMMSPDDKIQKDSADRMTGLLNRVGENRLDTDVLNHYVKKELGPDLKSATAFYSKYMDNPGFMKHPRIKTGILETMTVKEATKFSALSILSDIARQNNADAIFKSPDQEMAFMSALNNLDNEEVKEVYEDSDAYKDFVSKWNDYPSVQFEQREEILKTAAALVMAGSADALAAVQKEVLGSYATIRKPDFLGQSHVFKSKFKYYSNHTLIDDVSRLDNEDLQSVIIQSIAEDRGISLQEASKYRDVINDNGATFTYNKDTKEYSVVLEDDSTPAMKSRFRYTPGKYTTTNTGKVIRN